MISQVFLSKLDRLIHGWILHLNFHHVRHFKPQTCLFLSSIPTILGWVCWTSACQPRRRCIFWAVQYDRCTLRWAVCWWPEVPWWKSYRQALGFAHPPTIGYLTNQLLGILPTNYWVSYQPTYNIPFINVFPPPLATHAFNDSGSSTTFLLSMFPPLGNPCLVLGFRF